MDSKRVKELMLELEEYATVSEHSTIKDAVVALSKAQLGLTYDRHHHRAVLVLDDDRRVIGKLTHWAMLRGLQAGGVNDDDRAAMSRAGLTQEFIQQVDERLPFRGTLALMCHKAAEMKVRDVMVAAREAIEDDAPLEEAITRMVALHMESLLVTRGGRVVGILRMSDVFEEIADMIRGGCEEPGG